MFSRRAHRPILDIHHGARSFTSLGALATVPANAGRPTGGRSAVPAVFPRNYQAPNLFIPRKSSGSQEVGSEETAKRMLFFRCSRCFVQIARTPILLVQTAAQVCRLHDPHVRNDIIIVPNYQDGKMPGDQRAGGAADEGSAGSTIATSRSHASHARVIASTATRLAFASSCGSA